jgi:lipid-binding SYLF domain-containing protein
MRSIVSKPIIPLMVIALLLGASPVLAGSSEEGRVDQATGVLGEIMAIPEEGIPPSLFESARGIAIFPGLVKVGFLVGGRYGTGVMMVRDRQGNWSNPCFVYLGGGSFGLQIGVQATDVILVFRTRRSIDNLKAGKFTLGADVAVAAGPVGRQAEAATDILLKAEILSYSRSRGLFAGISLEGAVLGIDDDGNRDFYGRGTTAGRIFAGKVSEAPESAGRLRETLARYSR